MKFQAKIDVGFTHCPPEKEAAWRQSMSKLWSILEDLANHEKSDPDLDDHALSDSENRDTLIAT